MLDELLATIDPLVQKNHNTLTINCRGEVGTMTGDLTKTRQILLNLLGNASKFTRNGFIELDVHRRAIAGRTSIEFVVTDTGVGMTPEQSSKIFDPFTHADTTARGTGLGLALVARYCQLMGGKVFVESELGIGSRFTVRLPVEVAPRTSESADSDVSAA
jgi:signal transduction histidine kinase